MNCSPPCSSVHRMSQTRILEWVAISFSKESSWPGDETCVSCVSCIGRQIFTNTNSATWEARWMSCGIPQAMFITVVVQLLSHVWLCNPMDYSTPGFPVLYCLPEFAQTHKHWVHDAIQSSHPLSPLLLLPSVFPSIRVFSNESALHIRWPKYWSFSFKISPFNDSEKWTSN